MKTAIAVLLCAGAAFAQTERRVVELKHITMRDFGTALPTRVDVDASQKLIVPTGQKNDVAEAEAIIAKLDQPKRNVELVFHILTAQDSAPAAAATKSPAELEPVLKQLRANFVFADYRLVDTAFIRAREGSEFTATGILPGDSTYRISAHGKLAVVSAEKGHRVVADPVMFVLRTLNTRASGIEKKAIYNEAVIQAPLDIREGQRVVLGKSASPAVGGAVFLVVSGKVVD